MISLHRIGHQAEEFHLNPDLVVTVEANPDTVITLTTGTKIVVAESPERVVAEIRTYRVDVLSGALSKRRQVGGDPQPHGIHARRSAQGMLLSIDRAQAEEASEPPDQPA
jgi:flagellar protein FlbD